MSDAQTLRDTPTRRRAVLLVDGDMLLAMFKAGHREYTVTEDALPEDARCVGGRVDGDQIRIEVESASFEPVPITQVLPILRPPVAVRDKDADLEKVRAEIELLREEQQQAGMKLAAAVLTGVEASKYE